MTVPSELSVPEGTAKAHEPVARFKVVLIFCTAGHVTDGALLSTTTTLKLQLLRRPYESTASHVTGVVPVVPPAAKANWLPLTRLQLTVAVPKLSLAVGAVQEAAAVLEPRGV